ncbi:MAG: purine-nucleoside phosphorylase [Myxococcota bacterium]|nr:purine-nucleoside phosphorylase [Myxococcota bacterium]
MSTVQSLRARFGAAPPAAVVLGSGLSFLRETAQDAERASYAELGLPQTGVAGHAGELVVGRLGQSPVALLAGRVHAYEGRPMHEVVAAVRALAEWGVQRFVLTNAAGSVNAAFAPGDIMLVEDHLNLMGRSPLVGPKPSQGAHFPDLSQAYDPRMRALATQAAQELGIPLRRGVYCANLGPSYETPAEVRMMRTMGADAVGMSTVPEVLALARLERPVVAFSLISNLGAGLSVGPLHHEEVQEAANAAGGKLGALITALLSKADA